MKTKTIFAVMLVLLLALVSCGGGNEAEPLTAADPQAGAAGYEVYEHPSGNFRVAQYAADVAENDSGVAFTDLDSATTMMVLQYPASEGWMDDLPAAAEAIVSGTLVNSGQAESVQTYPEDATDYRNGTRVYFDYSGPAGEGEGEIFLTEAAGMAYTLMLVTPDYEGAFEDWSIFLESFEPNP